MCSAHCNCATCYHIETSNRTFHPILNLLFVLDCFQSLIKQFCDIVWKNYGAVFKSGEESAYVCTVIVLCYSVRTIVARQFSVNSEAVIMQIVLCETLLKKVRKAFNDMHLN